MRTTIKILGGLSVALAIGGYVFIGGDRTPPVRYKTAPAARQTVSSVISATGTINPVVAVQVGTQVTGSIQSLHADFNSVVRSGQVVARIDPSTYQAKRDQASALLTNAVAARVKAATEYVQRKREFVRAESLIEQQFVSQNEVDVARTAVETGKAQLDVAEAQVKQAKAQLDAADLDLKYTVIRSPVDGIVIARNVEVGQTVTAGFQTPMLFLIALDLDRMQVDTSVSEADIGGITAGKPALFTVDAYPTEQFRGVVKQVRMAPINVQNVVTYDVVVEVDNRDQRLRPGMTASVTIVVAQKEGVLTVPNGALRFTPPKDGRRAGVADAGQPKLPAALSGPPRHGKGVAPDGRRVVWRTMPSGEVEAVPLTLGLSDGVVTEVLSDDLREGEAVIIGVELPPGERSGTALPPGFGSSRPGSR